MGVFYLKLQITLLNEMLQHLFMARRHLAGYFLVVWPELCDFITWWQASSRHHPPLFSASAMC